LLVTLAVSGLVAALVVACVVVYRRRAPAEGGAPIVGSFRLQAPLIVLLSGLAVVAFAWGAYVYLQITATPKNPEPIYVVAKQWMWKAQHQGGQEEINEVHVPVGQPVELTMISQDVIHDFSVPEFRVKADVLPGRYTTLSFEADQAGTYHLFCDQYCGAEHSRMVGSIVVMSAEDYAAWLAGGPVGGQSPVAVGAQLFQSLACYTCHEMGPGWMARGPSLQGVYGHQVPLQGGDSVLADEAYLRESILLPAAKVVKGWQPIMPTYQGQVSEEQLIDLIAYLKSLGSAPAMGTGAVNPPGTSSPMAGGPAGSMPASPPAPSAGGPRTK